MTCSLSIEPIDVGYLGLERAAAAFLVQTRNQSRSHARGDADLPQSLLVECGTAACLPRLEAGLTSRGVPLSSIAGLFLTHIHLDHAGGAGHVARAGSDVFVHPFGVKHLVDPAKLIASSRRVHGAKYDRFYLDPLPCPVERVRAVHTGETIECAGLQFTALETPGHARHHHAWLLVAAGRRVLFSGDIAAMRLPDSSFISVPTPPPEFDLDAWRSSLDTLRTLVEHHPQTELWLTHFGRVEEPRVHLARTRERLDSEVAFALTLLETADAGIDEREVLGRYRDWLWPQAAAEGVSDARLRAFLGPEFFRMNLAGIRRWRDQTQNQAQDQTQVQAHDRAQSPEQA